MKVLNRFKTTLLISTSTVIGLAIGIAVYFASEIEPNPSSKSIERLIRELRKQDTHWAKSWQAIWAKLPASLTIRFPNLGPRPAVDVRQAAALELKHRAPNATNALPALIDALQDSDQGVVLHAIQALGEFGPVAKKSLPGLVSLYQAQPASATGPYSGFLRGEAALALASVAPDDSRVLVLLSDALESKEFSSSSSLAGVRRPAVVGLARMAKHNPKTGEILMAELEKLVLELQTELLNRPNETSASHSEMELANLRIARSNKSLLIGEIISGLQQMAPETPGLIPVLISLLTCPQRSVQLSAIQALGDLGSAAAPAVHGLVNVLRRSKTQMIESAPDGLIVDEFLERYLFSPNAALANSSASPPPLPIPDASVRLPPGALIPGVVANRLTQIAALRWQTIQALGKIGPAANNAVAALVDEYQNSTNQFRLEAAAARWKIDGNADEVRPVLAEGLNSETREVRRSAVKFLRQLGEASMPDLMRALTNEDYGVRSLAAEALGGLGSRAQPAAPILRKLLSDPKVSVHYFAERALKQIHSDSFALSNSSSN